MAIKKSQGSALLISLVLMSIIAVIAFGIIKTALFQVANVNNSENGLQAMYAAEAGMNIALKSYATIPTGNPTTADIALNNSTYSWGINQLAATNTYTVGSGSTKTIGVALYSSGSTIRVAKPNGCVLKVTSSPPSTTYTLISTELNHDFSFQSGSGSGTIALNAQSAGCTGIVLSVTAPLVSPDNNLIGLDNKTLTATGKYGNIKKQITYDVNTSTKTYK